MSRATTKWVARYRRARTRSGLPLYVHQTRTYVTWPHDCGPFTVPLATPHVDKALSRVSRDRLLVALGRMGIGVDAVELIEVPRGRWEGMRRQAPPPLPDDYPERAERADPFAGLA